MMLRWKRYLYVIVVLVVVFLTFYYSRKLGDPGASVMRIVMSPSLSESSSSLSLVPGGGLHSEEKEEEEQKNSILLKEESTCQLVKAHSGDISTPNLFPNLNFDGEWLERREYWNLRFEKRYKKRRALWSKLPLKVIVVPHSHNDPGWLKTFESYFHSSTKNILNFAVDKLTKYKNMTFIWTEISFLQMWWETAHPARKENFKRLVKEGRLEIPTGGWIMTDEANVHVYSMLDQLIEGHQWLKNTLGFVPKTSWSVDPFGHGKTFPYLLKNSGIDGMLIMRIHYAWKEWFARNQNGDFLWEQSWDMTGENSILCHNFPYDIYSIKGSCGPSAQVCLEFNFRKVSGEFTEYTARYTPITYSNVQERAELLIKQYGKTGSLFPHNVVLVPLGDDFTYDKEIEWDQQYTNYKTLFDYINSRYDDYHVDIGFGTVKNYFDSVRERMSKFQTLTGDFFVYSDIFSEGIPAYWSGYYSTRPFMKQLAREVENNLRSAEILFTLGYNSARQSANDFYIDRFQSLFGKALVPARRNLALFQHHDAITGTAKQYVMTDYGEKLFSSLKNTRDIQKEIIQYLLTTHSEETEEKQVRVNLRDDFERGDFAVNPLPIPSSSTEDLVIFNSLANRKVEIASVFLLYSGKNSIKVTDLSTGEDLPFQVNPTWNATGAFRLNTRFIEVVFFAEMPPLSVKTFRVRESDSPGDVMNKKTSVYWTRGGTSEKSHPYIHTEEVKEGDIRIENSEYKLVINGEEKLLSSVTHKKKQVTDNLEIHFGKYPTAQFRSGAYLFKPDEHQQQVMEMFDVEKNLKEVVIISGQIFSELSTIFEVPGVTPSGPHNLQSENAPGTFTHTVRLYHAPESEDITKGIYIENNFDLGGSLQNRDIDVFMRLVSSEIDNGRVPVFYTDSSGFQMQKRIKTESIGIEGNYFPLTSSAFIEDVEMRLSLLVDHAQGAASWQTGMLEVMVDRRSSYDDSRGMGEGVLDSRLTSHKYWLLLEPKDESGLKSADGTPEEPLLSTLAHSLSRRLNYPSTTFLAQSAYFSSKKSFHLLSPEVNLPCDLHLFNLRTLPNPEVPAQNIPSDSALLIFHKQVGDCGFLPVPTLCSEPSTLPTNTQIFFNQDFSRLKSAVKTSLTGVNDTSERVESFVDYLHKIKPMTLSALRITF